MSITIDKDIPVPEGTSARFRTQYPYRTMEVGDSFLIPFVEGESKVIAMRRMYQSASWATKRFAPQRFIVRRTEEGVRVWRTE